MATVKILYDDSAKEMEEYLKRKQEKEGPTTEHLCFLDGMRREFQQLQSDSSSRGNESIHLIQSWSPAESQKLSREQIHEMGVALADRFAPGHQYVVQTHTEEAHSHNHIVINPVSLETGKRIQNKLDNIHKVRDLNDQICRERGLEVLPPQEKLTRPGPNEKVRRIEAYRGRSYIIDLAHKADFARTHATGYDEYVSILGSFDIQVRIEPKNIVYLYPGKNHGKRGRNLSPELDKPALERAFQANRKKVPERSVSVSESAVPIEEVQRAKSQSILAYCEKEKIRLSRTQNGKQVLEGREHVEISDYSWINHRNKTRGNLIDFVANHREVDFLEAVAAINDNPRLLLLKQGHVTDKKRYQSFYIPREDPAPRAEAIASLVRLLGHSAQHPVHAELLKRQMAHVTRQGAVRFFSEKSQTGYLEYLPDSSGRYHLKKQGSFSAPFLDRPSRGRDLHVYTEPRSFLQKDPHAFVHRGPSQSGVLVLFEPDLTLIHQTLARQKNVSSVQLIAASRKEAQSSLRKFSLELERSLDPFSIDLALTWTPAEPELEQSFQPEIDRSLTRNEGGNR